MNLNPIDSTNFFELPEVHSLPLLTESKRESRRIKIKIPKHYQQEPIVFYLVFLYKVTVNINSAMLGVNGNTDGWFDLEISGQPEAIDSALGYLSDLDIENWTGKTLLESTFLRSL